jgi:hypothetical protein
MQIDATNHLTPLPERRRSAGVNHIARRDEANFTTADALSRVLRDAAEVRPEEVARARAVVDDKFYPPEETIRRIANLMAMHINVGE